MQIRLYNIYNAIQILCKQCHGNTMHTIPMPHKWDYESGWKWMKMDESGWKWMKVDESGWKWMKVDESGWKFMKVFESWWNLRKCIKIVFLKIAFLKDFYISTRTPFSPICSLLNFSTSISRFIKLLEPFEGVRSASHYSPDSRLHKTVYLIIAMMKWLPLWAFTTHSFSSLLPSFQNLMVSWFPHHCPEHYRKGCYAHIHHWAIVDSNPHPTKVLIKDTVMWWYIWKLLSENKLLPDKLASFPLFHPLVCAFSLVCTNCTKVATLHSPDSCEAFFSKNCMEQKGAEADKPNMHLH